MHDKALDVRFKWTKPEANPKFKTQWNAERKQGFVWRAVKGEIQLRWTSEEEGGYTINYDPPPGLFRWFSNLSGRVEILAFANAFGDILAAPGSEFWCKDRDGLRVGRRYAPLRLWEREIRRMRHAVRLWDASNTGARWTRSNAEKEMHAAIARAIQDRTTPCCTIVRLNAQHELIACPVNLLAFMWMTLARLASGEIKERPCEKFDDCGDYIYVGRGPGMQRDDTTTCSAACRQKKKRQAAQN